jgi:AraC-like DNA-binding protein
MAKVESVTYSRLGSGLPQLLLAGRLTVPEASNRITRQPDYFLFHYVLEGSGFVGRFGRKMERVEAGKWFLCFPNQVIQYMGDPRDPWRYRWLGFRGGEVTRLLLAGGIDEERLIFEDPNRDRSELIMAALQGSLDRRDWSGEIEAGRKLFDLLEHLTQCGEGGFQPSLPTKKNPEEEIDRAIRFMVMNISSGIRVEDVVQFVGLERSYFSKLFSQRMGHSIREHLGQVRMGQAEVLIRQDGLNIEEIARTVGFEDIRPLLRLFRKKYGKTPSQQKLIWREKEQK